MWLSGLQCDIRSRWEMTIYTTQSSASCNLQCDIHAWMYYIEQRDKWTSSCRGAHPEVHYLQPAHTSANITKRITGLCSKPAMVHTISVYTLLCTDGFDAVHLAVSAISDSFGAIGLLQDSKKNYTRAWAHARAHTHTHTPQSEKDFWNQHTCLCLQPGERLDFSHASHATTPASTELSALPQGCNNTLLHLSSLYDPATLHLAPLKPMLTVIENTQVCHLSFLSSVLCYLQPS